jgi:hypothetical protein
MPLNVRKGITVAFLLVSLVFIIIVSYSTNLYFAVFATVRHFNVSIPELNVEVANSSYILISTPIIIQNPSECLLEITQIVEGLRLENVFVLSSHKAFWNPVQLHPASTVNVTINAEVPYHRIQHVIAHSEKYWIVDLRIFLTAQIAGSFSWQKSLLITDVNLMETSP